MERPTAAFRRAGIEPRGFAHVRGAAIKVSVAGHSLESLVAVLAILDVASEIRPLAGIELLAQETLKLFGVWTGIRYHRCVPKKW
jgi:hypothetical protein